MRRCTHASVRRMGLQILCSKALSRDGEVASRIWWGSDRASGAWASVAADNLRSYVRDSDPFIGKKAVDSEYTMAAIIEKTESEEHKAAL
jgi:hypothetical protein